MIHGLRRPAYLVTLTVAVLAGLAACSGDTPARTEPNREDDTSVVVEPATQAQSGGVLRYGLVSDSVGWNPTSTMWTSSGEEVSRAIFDRLAAFDSAGDARPDLAESITPNADATQWEIRLRPGVTLHNGEVVDGQTVRVNLETFRASPTTAALLSPVETITTTGELSVQITMNQPWIDFMDTLTTQVGIVADPAWLASGDGEAPVGTGPFVFGEWLRGDRLTVNRNPAYWRTDPAGTSLPYLDSIVFEPLPDPDVRLAKLEAGRLDIIQTGTAEQIKRIAELGDQSDLQVFDDEGTESPESFIQLNTAVGPFNDVRSRRALALGTDTATFVDVLELGLVDPAVGPFEPTSPWYAETDYPGYDPAAARDLVESLASGPDAGVTFTVLGPSEASALSALQLLQEQWTNVGMTAVIEVVEPAELARRVAVGDYQAVLWEQFDGPQPSVDLAHWDPAAAAALGVPALNSARNVDPEIGALISSLRAAETNDGRKALYAALQQRLATDIPYVWLVHEVRGVFAHDEIVNVVQYDLPGGETGIELERGTHPLWQIWRSH